MRFVAVQEPPHDSWAVFDPGTDTPVEYAGLVLIGLTLHEAHRFAAVANDHTGRRQHSRPVRLQLVRSSPDAAGPTSEKHDCSGS